MGISRKTDYAIRAIRSIYSSDRDIVSRRIISEDENIPINFLTSILSEMSKAGLVSIFHGKNGGYSLKKDLKDITLLDIIKIFHGTFSLNACLEDDFDCPNIETCRVNQEFNRIQNILDTELSRYSLYEIVVSDLYYEHCKDKFPLESKKK